MMTIVIKDHMFGLDGVQDQPLQVQLQWRSWQMIESLIVRANKCNDHEHGSLHDHTFNGGEMIQIKFAQWNGQNNRSKENLDDCINGLTRLIKVDVFKSEWSQWWQARKLAQSKQSIDDIDCDDVRTSKRLKQPMAMRIAREKKEKTKAMIN